MVRPDLSVLPRHCHRDVRAAIKDLPDSGDWRLVKKKDHCFLYDGEHRITCACSNGSVTPPHYVKMTVAEIVKYAKRYSNLRKEA